MGNIIQTFLVLLLMVFVFVAGMRWESHHIKYGIEHDGYAISRSGDHIKYKITGKIEKVED